MNPQHNKVRQVLKWAGLVFSLIVLVAWVASVFVSYIPCSNNHVVVCFSQGGITYVRVTNQQAARPSHHFYWRPKFRGIQWIPKLNAHTYAGYYSFLPMWCPFLIFTIPTYILWRRDRRHPKGHCQKCGYDLTGNDSGICPECGSKIGIMA